MKIGTREIGPGEPVFVVAEISCNHAGSFDHALALINAAHAAGADAVKFQAYTPTEMTCQSDHPAYRLTEGPWAGRTLWELYTEAQTPLEWFPALTQHANFLGLVWFASVFGPESLAAMEALGCPAYKIASAEVTDLALVRAVAATGKPVLMSDGMATDGQLEAVVKMLWEWDGLDEEGDPISYSHFENLVALHCVSDYPSRPESYSLGCLQYESDLSDPFTRLGLSDHTTGNDVAVAAVALGACVIEKHLMLDLVRYGDGPAALPLDVGHSVTPIMFQHYVEAIRATEAMVRGTARRLSGDPWRRRLVYARDLPVGHVLEAEDVRTARCGAGRLPDDAPIGERLLIDVWAGDPVL